MVNWLHTELSDSEEKIDMLEKKFTEAQEMIKQKEVKQMQVICIKHRLYACT